MAGFTVPSEVFSPAALAITQGISMFTTFLPHLTDIRRTDPTHDPAFATDVRLGEFGAAAMTIGMGIVMSLLTGHNAPLYVGLIVALGMTFFYEWALRLNPLEQS